MTSMDDNHINESSPPEEEAFSLEEILAEYGGGPEPLA